MSAGIGAWPEPRPNAAVSSTQGNSEQHETGEGKRPETALDAITIPPPSPDARPVPAQDGIQQLLASVREAIAQGENPLAIARRLAVILATGLQKQHLAHELGVSPPWVSKRLGLLSASVEVQRLIESGELSETAYYNHREKIELAAQGSHRERTLPYQRLPTVAINIEAAQMLATILQKLAQAQGLTPIRLARDASKKELTSVLNLRAGEILRGLK